VIKVHDGTDGRHTSILNFRRDEILHCLEKSNIVLSSTELKTKYTIHLAIKRLSEGVQENLMECLGEVRFKTII
jgi:hypothetical protein